MRDQDDAPPRAASTVRVISHPRGPEVLLALIALFLAVAWLKPWPASPRETGPTGRPVPSASPPAAPADPLADLRHHCQEPRGWRVYSHQRWSGVSVRSWRSVEPARSAAGPLDRRIPVTSLAVRIEALGFCSPWATSERPPGASRVIGWQVLPGAATKRGTSDTAREVDLSSVAPDPPSVLGMLFEPPAAGMAGDGDSVAAPPDAAGSAGAWPSGRWVFVVRAPGYERWWAVEVEDSTVAALPGPP